MKFIEMSGATLREVLREDEVSEDDLQAAGVDAQSVIRINMQGDIEVRRAASWDLIGGLLGDFERRVKKATDLEWV